MKILMVDGDPSGHAVIAEILKQRGCHLLEVDGGEEALKIAHQEKPEIAIVDVLTPRLDRGEFVRQLRSDPAIARMPVIFYTDGYLEIASGLARDINSLVTPVLLYEEAIRGKVSAGQNVSALPAKEEEESAHSEGEGIQEVFGFGHGTGGERTLIRPGDLLAEIFLPATVTADRSALKRAQTGDVSESYLLLSACNKRCRVTSYEKKPYGV